jgi:hypothetical protein
VSKGNTRKPDATIAGNMGFYTITPLSKRARSWLNKHTDPDEAQRDASGGIVFDDGRYARDIMEAMETAGLVFEVSR